MGFAELVCGPQQCYEKIKDMLSKKQYESLDECFANIKCSGLTVSEVISMYSRLKFELEEEEVVKIGKNKVDNFSRDYTSGRNRWIRSVEDFYG